MTRDLRPAKPAVNYAESDGSNVTPHSSPSNNSGFDVSFGSSNTSLELDDSDVSEDELQQSAAVDYDDDDVIQGTQLLVPRNQQMLIRELSCST